MGFERFIARHMTMGGDKGEGFSRLLTRTATGGIALGVVVMVMAVTILHGFQKNITSKLSGFGSHITLHAYTTGNGFIQDPINPTPQLIDRLKTIDGVHHVQPFADKGGMVKTDEQIHGIVLHGLPQGFDSSFFKQYIVKGRLPQMSNDAEPASTEVLISQTVARALHLDVGSKMRTYFWQGDNYRARMFTICGLYNTDLEEMDKHYVVGDLRQAQRLNDWNERQVGGIEVNVNDFDQLDDVAMQVASTLPYDVQMSTIVQQQPTMFSWLDLLNTNIALILTIRGVVCVIATVSALLIMIYEKSATIGVLKALGASHASIGKIFIIRAWRMVAWGVLIGDAIAVALCLLQERFKIVRLDPESYSMPYVPIDLDATVVLLISAITALTCLVSMIVPTALISRISPSSTIRTEH